MTATGSPADARDASPSVGERLDHAIESTQEKAHSAKERTKDAVSHGAHAVSEQASHLAERGKDALGSARHYAQENPGRAVLIGVVAGFLLHSFLRR
jgi:ElaB/YqjD/DUF883 family membrane-anchored ribosome-binding protein